MTPRSGRPSAGPPAGPPASSSARQPAARTTAHRGSEARRVAALLLLTACGAPDAAPRADVVLATTHTLDDSGLLDSLTAAFRAEHPALHLRVVVSGTGEALEHARRGVVDVVLSHAPEAEAAAVRQGVVLDRHELMHNTFIIVGPADDPVGVRGMQDAPAALARIADSGARFVSRDDGSGTNLRELALWRDAGREPPAGSGYVRAGVGMADALRIADERAAYTLSDTATWAVLHDGLRLVPLVSGDPRLRNTYAVMRVAAAPDSTAARILAGWLTGPSARAVIARFGAPGGSARGLFVPAAPERETARDTAALETAKAGASSAPASRGSGEPLVRRRLPPRSAAATRPPTSSRPGSAARPRPS